MTPSARALVSIVTPVIDEEANLPLRAAELAREAAPWEWIVVDGGSADDSIGAARRAGARVLAAPPGRGGQLNAGARVARGAVLLFLHADTALPNGALAAIRRALADPAIGGGNFRFRFDDASAAGELLRLVYAAKQRVLGVWYGDSAMFVRRDVFERLGGFAPFPIMEDLDLVRRLRRSARTVRLPLTVVASRRRYDGRVVRTVAQWLTVLALFELGVSPHVLVRLYRPRRSR